MTPAEFLQTVSPERGHRVLLTGWHPVKLKPGEQPRKPVPWTFPQTDFESAATFIERERGKWNVFHAMFSFKDLYEKVLPSGRKILSVKRSQANAAYVRAFFGDLDVDPSNSLKLESKSQANSELVRFCESTGFPEPMIVNSGNGYHIYWLLAEDMAVDTWQPYADKLLALCAHYGFKVDGSAMADAARMLRPVGSLNRKDEANPKEVKVVGTVPDRIPNAVAMAMIDKAGEVLPPAESRDHRSRDKGSSSGDLPHPKVVADVCPTFAQMVHEAPTASEPVWWKTLDLVQHTLGGDKLAHKLSALHPHYSPDETQEKLDRFREQAIGPPTCGSLQKLYGANSSCPSCPNFGQPKSSPIVFARREAVARECGARVEDFHAYMPAHNYIHTPTGEFWPAASVDGRLPRVALGSKPDGTAKTMAPSRWLDRHRPVTQLTWAPGEPQVLRDRACRDGELIRERGVTCFNLYRPPIPIEGGDPSLARRWIELVHRLYPEDADHIIACMAHRVQRPEEKINHALVLGGAQGVGKDTILEPLVRAVGSWNFSDITPQQLAGSFNTFVKCVVLRINEVHDLGDLTRHQFYEKSKTLITTPPEMIRVNQKYLNEYSIRNCCGVVMTTNHKAGGIYLPPDDRRHFVAWSTCDKADFPSAFWAELWAWYEAEGFAHVAAFLRAYDLSNFDPKAPPPKTAAFWEIVNAGRAPEEAELAGVIERLGNPAALTLGKLDEATKFLDTEVGDWLRDRKNRRIIPARLEQCGYVAVENQTAKDRYWTIAGKRVPVYAKADLSIRDRQRAVKALVDGSADPPDR